MHSETTTANPVPARERGSALILALILVVVLTFVGFGLLTRSLLTTRIAGSERWSTRAFYAADGGINFAKQRLRIRQTAPFTYYVADLRSGLTGGDAERVEVQVSEMQPVGAPKPAIGTQVGGGQGSSTEPLFNIFYHGTSDATQPFTRSERIVESTMSLGPVPLAIPQ